LRQKRSYVICNFFALWLTEVTEETTPSPIEVAITKEQKVKKCKRKRKKPKPERVKCEDTEFGCCPDGIAVAEGPFSRGKS
jgi:hypothetical protein